VKHYHRTTEQNHALGLYSQEELAEEQVQPADDALTADKLQVPEFVWDLKHSNS
jgi:hypothetical protein